MLKKSIIILFLIIPFLSFSQSKKLRGQIFDSKTGLPVSGARIFLLNGPEDGSTNTDGEYELDLSIGNVYSLGKEIEVRVYHVDYGLSIHSIPITNKLEEDFLIKDSNTFGIFGIIKDNGTDAPLEGFEVSLLPNDPTIDKEKIESQLTDKFGRFQFIFKKSEIGKFNSFRYSINDPTYCYKPKQELREIGDFLEIRLENTGNCEEYSYKNFHRMQKDLEKQNEIINKLKMENQRISTFDIKLTLKIPITGGVPRANSGHSTVVGGRPDFVLLSKGLPKEEDIGKNAHLFYGDGNSKFSLEVGYFVIKYTFSSDAFKGKNITDLSRFDKLFFKIGGFLSGIDKEKMDFNLDLPLKINFEYLINGRIEGSDDVDEFMFDYIMELDKVGSFPAINLDSFP